MEQQLHFNSEKPLPEGFSLAGNKPITNPEWEWFEANRNALEEETGSEEV